MSNVTSHRNASKHRRSAKNAETFEDYVPTGRDSARSAQRIAMYALREQDRSYRGW
jgi:hypothetical protein